MTLGPTRRRVLAGIGTACLLWPRASWAQSLAGRGGDGPSLARIIASLTLCLVLAGGAALLLRRRLGLAPVASLARRSVRRLRLIEALRLNTQTQLFIVACDDRELLLAATSAGTQIVQSLSVVASLPDA